MLGALIPRCSELSDQLSSPVHSKLDLALRTCFTCSIVARTRSVIRLSWGSMSLTKSCVSPTAIPVTVDRRDDSACSPLSTYVLLQEGGHVDSERRLLLMLAPSWPTHVTRKQLTCTDLFSSVGDANPGWATVLKQYKPNVSACHESFAFRRAATPFTLAKACFQA